ncbi:hypothetical protein V6N13_108557 [Hibiscus sabdariffa]
MNMTWQIKSYIGNHTCMMGFKNRNATYKWLAKTYIEKYRVEPKFSTRHLKQDVMSDHLYKVSLSKCLRAKNLALEMVLGSHKGQYSMIYDYLGEIRTSNHGSTTILMLDNRVFLRMYICLHACKEGYKAGCRPVLSIDGCHLKGYYGGTFLAAVSVDANDSIYPIAYVVVEAETESSWNWFLSIVVDLGIESSHNITIVSDKQRGLKEATLEVFPAAEHRNCVRHLYSNFNNQQGFKGKNLKDALWKAARATYLKQFEDAMDELKALSKNAFDWLNGKDPAQWSKSHFSPRSKSDMLLSNLFECFNKMILEARDKPILTLMEMVRTKIMEKVAMKQEQSTRCWPTHAGGHKYKVSEGPLNQHAVDLENGTCSCRKWDITGIPCIHAISVMVLNNQRPKSFVHPCYKSTPQQQIYNHFIQPMRGPNQSVKDTSCEPVIEPKLRRPPGKPKKKRAKEADEAQNSGARWTKKGLTMYCSKCKKPGHNQRTCKGEVGSNQKRITTQTRGPSDSHSSVRTSKLQVRRATTLSSPHVMPTSSSPPVMPTTSASPHVMATSSSPPVMPTTSASPQIGPFVFIPTPGNIMRVRWMQSSQEDINGGQHLSQSSTITHNSQEEKPGPRAFQRRSHQPFKQHMGTYISTRELLDRSSSPNNNKLPLVVYFHGGGFILLSTNMGIFHTSCCNLANTVPVVVVSVEYHLAPEHRLPAAYEDGVEALHWIKMSEEEWLREYVDFSNCFLMGSSAGGNIAYHVGLRAAGVVQELQPLKIKGLVLHQPFFGGKQRSASELRFMNVVTSD